MKAYATLTDAELIEKLNQLDNTAFAEVYERYWDMLFNHAVHMLRDEQQAGDLVQDIFTNILVNMGKLEIPSTLSAYLHKAVRNRTIHRINHLRVRVNYAAHFKSFVQEGIYTTDERIREKEFKEQIEKEIAQLPPKMRVVFEMSRKAHLSHKEIAGKTAISEETVKRQISYALKILRSKLSSGFFLYVMSVTLMLNKLFL